MTRTASEWPALPLDRWRDTSATLHMWTQIAGKICLALTPRVNHFWNIAFQVTPRGLATPTMTAGERTFTITFDLVAHQLLIEVSDGSVRTIPLEPRSVAAFYRLLMDTLHGVGIDVRIWTMPVEIPDPIRFTEDEIHHAYDPVCANAFLRALLSIKPVFQSFRCDFVGKCSPVHFFWGSFDLAVTRFSGRRAPERPEADAMTRESYSHEVISHGFWPGSGAVPDAAFYAYAVPAPAGFDAAAVEPSAASYNREFGEFILPYEAVRRSVDPVASLTAFLNSTYEAGARLAGWDRDELERR
ncbi:MAG TPA: DUF5996 family protein [Candidatus Omnitrophota bacterium]|nr:DUF5996 family protein [Candidatus Omnitrophota bacterium]